MSEKRRLSTRNRGEPPLKKRALTPPPPPTAPAPRPPPPEPIEEGLPVKLREGQTLPTLAEPQEKDLSTKAFQTISERSFLLLASEISFLTDFPQWCTFGIDRTITAKMDDRGRIRTILDEAKQEKQYRQWPEPCEGDDDQARPLLDHHRPACLRCYIIYSERSPCHLHANTATAAVVVCTAIQSVPALRLIQYSS